MKKVTSLLLLAGVAAFGLVGCGDEVVQPPDPPSIDNVTVTPDELDLNAGQTATVTADVNTSNDVEGLELAWSSGNSNVATVSPTGDRTAEVTAAADGSTTITATATASNVDGQTSSSAAVQVSTPAVNSVSVSPSQASIQVGGTVTLVASVDAEEGADTSVSWSSSDASIASVSASGQQATVTGEGEGTATITVESVQNPNRNAAASVEVTGTTEPQVNDIEVTPANVTIAPGNTTQLIATVDADEGASFTVNWSSNNTSVATVPTTSGANNENATIEGQSAGTAAITAEAGGQQATASVQVEDLDNASVSFATQPGTNAGNLTWTMNVDEGDRNVDLVNLLVDGEQVASTQFGQTGDASGDQDVSGQVQQVQLSFNSAQLVDSDGDGSVDTNRFDNGSHTITAEVTSTSGQVLQQAQTSFSFSNANGFLVDLAFTGDNANSAVSGGVRWWRGDLEVDVQPVIFDAGPSIGSVSVAVDASDGTNVTSLTDSDGSDGFGVTFPDDAATGAGGLDDHTTGTVGAGAGPDVIDLTSTFGDGTTGPSTILGDDGQPTAAPSRQIDNEGPGEGGGQGGVFTLVPPLVDGWVGADYAIADGLTTVPGDVGVGGVTHSFFSGPSGGTLDNPVTVGSDITSSSTVDNDQFALRAQHQDALGNTTETAFSANTNNPSATDDGTDVGVDVDPPTASFTAPAAQEVASTVGGLTGGGTWEISVTDGGASGFVDDPMSRRIRGVNAANPTSTFLTATGAGGFVDNGPDNSPGDAIDLGDAGFQGYIQYEGFASDRGANTSSTITREVFVDGDRPNIGTVSVPASLPASDGSATFTLSATEDTELWRFDYTLNYPNLAAASAFTTIRRGYTTIDERFEHSSVTGSETVEAVEDPLITGIETVQNPGMGNDDWSQSPTQPNDIDIGVENPGGTTTGTGRATATANPSGNIAAPTDITAGSTDGVVDSWSQPTATNTGMNTVGSTVDVTATLTRADGEPGLFDRVEFYWRSGTAGVTEWHKFATVTTPMTTATTSTTVERTYGATFTIPGSGRNALAAGDDIDFLVLGFHTQGSALANFAGPVITVN